MKHPGFKRAMTFLELLVVLALFSLVLGLILPDFAARLYLTRIERVSHRMDLLFRECFHSAVFTGTARWVALTPGRIVEVHDRTPDGTLLETPFLKSFALPDWCDIEGLERAWCASPEGFCDSGPFFIRDKVTGEKLRFAVRPYDGEIEIR